MVEDGGQSQPLLFHWLVLFGDHVMVDSLNLPRQDGVRSGLAIQIPCGFALSRSSVL